MTTSTDKPPGGKMIILAQRAFSTCILLGLLAAALLWDHEEGYYGLVCVFCVLTAWEWRHMLRVSGKASHPTLSMIFGIVYPLALSAVCYMSKFTPGTGQGEISVLLQPLILVLGAPVLLVIISFMLEMKHVIVGSRPLRSVATTLLSFIYPGWLFAFAIPAIHLAYIHQGEVAPGIVMLVLWVVLVTKMADIFAYVSGMAVGGRFFTRKLIPHISPKKTWEGIIGSWVLTNIAGVGLLFPLCDPLSLGVGNLVCIMIGISIIFILSVFGDLAGSLIKRSLAVKDSGSLLPGIGGVFDLIDSPAFTVPFICLLFLLMY